MKVVPFIAASPAAALAQIREALGAEAVVVGVRPVPQQGLARFWQKNRGVEVLACVAEPGDPEAPWEPRYLAGDRAVGGNGASFTGLNQGARGLPALHDGSGRPHVFIGPPGTGKTTLLCKWMTLSVLNENRAAKVWRLDGPSANAAEFLNVYGEMLGVRVERFWDPTAQSFPLRQQSELGPGDSGDRKDELLLIDLPGVQPADAGGLNGLSRLLVSLSPLRLHLVLNAAYETNILLQQVRAFAAFEPEDLSFTHLDEEKNQAKLMDVILGTNCRLRFLSTGQKVPGDLVIAGTSTHTCAEAAA